MRGGAQEREAGRGRRDRRAKGGPQSPAVISPPFLCRHQLHLHPISVGGALAFSMHRQGALPTHPHSAGSVLGHHLNLAIGERLSFCCTPPPPLVGVSIWMERECQSNDSVTETVERRAAAAGSAGGAASVGGGGDGRRGGGSQCRRRRQLRCARLPVLQGLSAGNRRRPVLLPPARNAMTWFASRGY